MSKVFFLSYAKPHAPDGSGVADDASEIALVESFYASLNAEVSSRIPGAAVNAGFRDAENIRPGTPDYRQALSEGLRDHPIGIVLLSSKYVSPDRPWCKWEFQYLHERNEDVHRFCSGQYVQPPLLLLAINWSSTETLPPDFPIALQQCNQALAKDGRKKQALAKVCAEGLKDVLKCAANSAEDALTITHFIQALRDYILEQWSAFQRLERGGYRFRSGIAPEYAGDSRWQVLMANSKRPAEMHKPPSSKTVHVIYLAAPPEEVAAATPTPSQRVWRYDPSGESDWRLFAGAAPSDSDEHAGDCLHACVDERFRNKVELNTYQLAFVSGGGEEVVLKGVKDEQLIIIVVDPWTALKIRKYEVALLACVEDIATRKLNGSLMVICNDMDTESTDLYADMHQMAAKFKIKYSSRFAYARGELLACVTTVIERHQAALRTKAADDLATTGEPPPGIGAR